MKNVSREGGWLTCIIVPAISGSEEEGQGGILILITWKKGGKSKEKERKTEIKNSFVTRE